MWVTPRYGTLSKETIHKRACRVNLSIKNSIGWTVSVCVQRNLLRQWMTGVQFEWFLSAGKGKGRDRGMSLCISWPGWWSHRRSPSKYLLDCATFCIPVLFYNTFKKFCFLKTAVDIGLSFVLVFRPVLPKPVRSLKTTLGFHQICSFISQLFFFPISMGLRR